MNKQTETLNIALEEHRHDFVCSSLLQVMIFLENQGFTFEEVLDGLANYAYINAKRGDTVCFLVKASLSVKSQPPVADSFQSGSSRGLRGSR
jgi:hypothetical protein